MKIRIFTRGLCLYFIVFVLILGVYTEGVAQVAINTDGSAPSANTILDLNPAVGKAFLPPTMTWAQIKAITPSKAGMVVYDSEFTCLRMYNGSKWVCIGEQASLSAPPGNFNTQTMGGFLYDIKITSDALGNVYVIGRFRGTATFGTLTLTTVGFPDDIFIAKYNSSGTAAWVQKAGDPLGEEHAYGIAIDALGNVYVTGDFSGTATFGTLPSITSTGYRDIFLAKYNSNGTALWVQKAGSATQYANSKDIALDMSGNPYITGYFQGTLSFGTLAPISASAGDLDIFITKYNSNGTAIWVQKAGGTNLDFSEAITLDASDNIYITGKFNGIATFGTLPSIISGGDSDIFTAKYTNDGTALWVKKAGGADYDYSKDIVVDASGNVFIIGSCFGSATFGALVPTSSGGFIAKYNTLGTEIWVQQNGGVAPVTVSFNGIALDVSGNLYTTGSFTGTATFGNLPSVTALGTSDIFVAKYNNNGTAIWVQKAGGTELDSGYSITVDQFGNVYTIGDFQPPAQFGNQVFTSGRMFLMRYSE